MVESKSRIPQSNIPVMTPRPAQNSTSNASLATQQYLGLVPPSRHLAVSGSPSPSTPGSSPSANSGSGIASFRSFRNLLPFGPGKNQTQNASPGGPSKPSLASFGSLRRSVHGDRSVSTPHLRPEPILAESPVLSIELSHPFGEPLLNTEELRNGLGLYANISEPPQPRRASLSSNPASRVQATSPSGPMVGISDLSTILESETSGISKHIPPLDDSQEPGSQRDSEAESTGDAWNMATRSDRDKSSNQRIGQPDNTPRRRSFGSQETSALDLSTSKVTSEVLEALSDANSREDWLHGLVIDDVGETDHGVPCENRIEPDVSFNLSALDPDLAALLSPNRLKGSQPTLTATSGSLSPLPTTARLPESRRPSISPSRSPVHGEFTLRPQSRSPIPSPSSASRLLVSSTSPAHRNKPLPSAPSKFTPPSSVPRLARSVSERPSFTRAENSLTSSTVQTPKGRASDVTTRPTTGDLQASKRRGIAGTAEPLRRTQTEGDVEQHKPAASRLVTPARPYAAPAGSALRHINTAQSNMWDGESSSPASRSPSSLSTPSSKLAHPPRPSLDGLTDKFRVSQSRRRDRSASVSGGRLSPRPNAHSPPVRPSAEWLGPRTAKAFAAAGLLDFDREGGPTASRPGSRFGTARSTSDRDFRSQYAPSRMGFSEAGSASSWGRRSGSISHATAMSEAGGALNDSVSTTPRTTFSGSSTAPTSVSAASSVHQHLQSELQTLQDRHALETGALLNALADSQRTTKMLRDENVQLRDRIQQLEDRLADTLEQLHRMQYNLPPSLSRIGYQHLAGNHSADSLNRRVYYQSRLRSRLNSESDADHDAEIPPPNLRPSLDVPRVNSDSSRDTETQSKPHRRRHSNSSSVFAALPTNMDMLVHEEAVMPEHSAAFSVHSISPSSPTLVIQRLPGKQSQGPQPGHHRTASSAGNISPTTANFSMTTGSPGSLNLHPDHERLLGDMPSLDLHAEDLEP